MTRTPWTRTLWAWVRVGVGAGIIVLLVARVGADPFLDALRMISPSALAAALGITALTTACCAWRWSLVARSLGVRIAPRAACAAYYRSQFLNATLPGGVLGDVHRGVRHGRHVGAVGRSLRSVAWERGLGQLVQVAFTAIILLALPSPVRSPALALVVAGGVAACVLGVACHALLRDSSRSRTGPVGILLTDLDAMLRTRRAAVGIMLASAGAVLGHTLIFLIAVRTAGETAPTSQVLPLALIVLLASALPTNIAGWGPREGVAAWAFSTAGLGASVGIASGVVYGVMALVATLPGAVVMIADRRRRDAQPIVEPVPRTPEAAVHG